MKQESRIVAFLSERMPEAPAPESFGRPVGRSKGGSPVVRKAREQTQPSTIEVVRPTGEPEISPEEKQILRKALKHRVFKHGHLLVPTSIHHDPLRPIVMAALPLKSP